MKKTTTLVLALTLVFAMSTTAFAAGETAGTAQDFAANSATTQVRIISAAGEDGTTQVSATVPLTVTLAIAADGKVTGPTNYTITNTSVMPVKVTNVSIAAQDNFYIGEEGTGTCLN
ncbi:MAG: hypothetical protein Q4C22_06970, partial [Bacillota bacterium]|nr:hypothetical protein [Bacillota bacterium]